MVEKNRRPLGFEEMILHCGAPVDSLTGLLEGHTERTFPSDTPLIQHQRHFIAAKLLHRLAEDVVVQFSSLQKKERCVLVHESVFCLV